MRTRLIILLLILICGCAVGPDYQRPGYPVPPNYRGEGPDIPKQPAAASFGDLKWFEVFQDEKLQELIKIALQENYDVQIAAQRVLQAREQIIIQRSFLFPTLNANGQLHPIRTSERGINFMTPRLERVSGLVFGDVAWELDFFGRIRRATEAARAVVPDLKRAIEQKENLISVLTGRNPGPIIRGKSLLEQDLTVSIPPGLTSTLLERRPDIRFAEQTLVAANARIGEAKALLFPNIRITGASGWESAALKSLFTGPASFWDLVAPGITQPIFNAGRLRAGVRVAEAVKQEALLTYKKSIQQAFQEVSDSLVGVRMLKEVRIETGKQVKALSQQTDLAYQRYYGGVTPYLEVLDSDRQLFESELKLSQDRANEFLAVIALYRALGGGWQNGVEPAGPPNQDAAGTNKRNG